MGSADRASIALRVPEVCWLMEGNAEEITLHVALGVRVGRRIGSGSKELMTDDACSGWNRALGYFGNLGRERLGCFLRGSQWHGQPIRGGPTDTGYDGVDRSNRSENCAFESLIATRRSRRVSRAAYTSPIPPLPSGERIS